MREIKFRAWHNKDKYMIESAIAVSNIVAKFIRNFTLISPGFGGDAESNQPTDPDTYTLMQFTNLLDKNGVVEVYEGDIFNNEGMIIGNLYETPKIYQAGINYYVAELCTSAWKDTEERLLSYGFKYAK